MLFVDSLYINNSGGLRLLLYLINQLQLKDIRFVLLADSRCKGLFDNIDNIHYLKANLKNRYEFYRKFDTNISSVFCFGNIPPPIKKDVPVFTYFHNINLLTLSECNSHREKFISFLKRLVFRYYKSYTNFWIVQSSNTRKELIYHLKETDKRVLILPFFEISKDLELLKHEPHGNDYAFISNYTGAKGHEELLDAWKILHKKGIDIALHLTIPDSAKSFINKIEMVKEEGVNIINHGFVDFNSVCDIYRCSKAIVYPSHNESLGLGLIEAIEANCDLLAADLPYVHSVCIPSMTFNPYSPDDIARTIMRYEEKGSHKPKLTISNELNKLIEIIAS